ncbi:unnamed protein product [Paramecium pentaurelia]|uniref:Tetratricopeptide repeat protein n=1 Tax=Paramecium pentaurelia TaxID=43138 RepID=A0A8S1XWL2_9CILI|nr:unnamed protein product [Paramecium pentaurelia]
MQDFAMRKQSNETAILIWNIIISISYLIKKNIVMLQFVLIKQFNGNLIFQWHIIIKKYSDAIECFDDAILLDSNFAIAYNNKGISLEKLKKYDESLANFSYALKIDSKYSQAYMNKGNIYQTNKVMYYETSKVKLKISKMKKKQQQAIDTYMQAISYCQLDENEFKRLILEPKNKI